MSITPENKIIATTLRDVIGGTPSVIRYWDSEDKYFIDILSSSNRPATGISSFATIGLSDYDIGFRVDTKPLRVEFVGVCESRFNFFLNIIGDCALLVIKERYESHPGVILPDVIHEYLPESEMKHIFLTTPFIWEDTLVQLEFCDKTVTWLLAVPISDTEFEYADKNGTEALEDEFVKHDVDISNIVRSSIL